MNKYFINLLTKSIMIIVENKKSIAMYNGNLTDLKFACLFKSVKVTIKSKKDLKLNQ